MGFRRTCLVLLWSALSVLAQRRAGEMRLQVMDPAGLPLEASGTLSSQANQVTIRFETGGDGHHIFKPLPFGPYQLKLERAGFTPFFTVIFIDSESPVRYRATLGLAPIETAVTIQDATLLDPAQTGSVQHLGAETIKSRRSAAPGRSVVELVNTQPGWLLEANGVLHPRGSEYDVQYVIDGVPLPDNRSPAFAQSLGVEEFQSMRIMTGGYPAEYGRKLGGVIEVSTDRPSVEGLHGAAVVQAGSFGTTTGYASAQLRKGPNTFAASGEGMGTSRYLDAPVEANFTNRASSGGASLRFERDWNADNRTRIYAHSRRTRFLVPNETLQQEAGQRQDRSASETLGHVSHQHVFTPSTLGTARVMVRDTNASLWSNTASVPIAPFQDRGFRELYGTGTFSIHRGAHEWKAGAEAIFASIRENFGFDITAYRLRGERIFDRDVPARFRFAERRQGREQAAFLQDSIRLGRLTLSAGVRYDHYRLVADEHAVSPRIAAAWHVPSRQLALRASYDRVFQTPAVENLLLASADLIRSLGGEGLFLPLRPSRGNFWEAGFSKTVAGKLRLDGSWFRRDIRNFADDSLLFNTGVSFPTAFDRAAIIGYEAKIEVPRWGVFSGFLSYANMTGAGRLPIAGGLFLGDEAEELLESTAEFPITQDQRNTVRARIRGELGPRAWAALGARYNSGLPVEIEDELPERSLLVEQYGARVVERVNFSRGRVLPSAALDISAAVDVLRRETRKVTIQADILNLTNRLNVINFAGLFSGTAIEPRRSAAIRLQVEF